MKNLFLIGIAMFSMNVFAENRCPCPGPCCPNVHLTGIIDMASYLSPWATQKTNNEVIEKDLNCHKL